MCTTGMIEDRPQRPSDGTAAPVDGERRQLLCGECAARGRTCCQGHDIFVTRGDCRRIMAITGSRSLFEYRGCSHLDYGDQSDDPLWFRYVFRPDGSRRVLKRQANGDCILLTATGCRLPLASRPLVCRLFPHLYSAAGITGGWDPECLAARTMDASVIEKEIAGTARNEAIVWHMRLYDEIVWEKFNNADWINL